MKTYDKQIGTANSIAGGLGFAAYFTFFLKDGWRQVLGNPILLQSARLYLFPFIGLTDLVRTVLSWRQAKRDHFKGASLFRALQDTVSLAVVVSAITIAFTIGAIYNTIAPIMFTALLGFNSLVHLASAIYYGVQGNKGARNDHLVGFAVLGLFSASIGMLTFIAKPLLALVGIAGSFLGVGYSVFKGYKEYKVQLVVNAEQVVGGKEKENVVVKQKSSQQASMTFNKDKVQTKVSGYTGSLTSTMAKANSRNDAQYVEKKGVKETIGFVHR